MNVKQIGDALVTACQNGKEADLLNTLYHPDAISVEAMDFSGAGRETMGVDGIRGKHAWWAENFEVHDATIIGPYVHGDDRFAVTFEMEATTKATGERSKMKEVAIYHVADGKIVREEFFGTE